MTTPTDEAVPPRRRRRFRLTLRAMMLMVLILAVPLGWKVNKARRQSEAVKAVLRAGGTVAYDYEYGEDGRSKRVKEPPRWRWLISRLGVDVFHRVHRVAIKGGKPIEMTIFEDLPDLRMIEVENTRLLFPDGPSSGQIAPLPWLKKLRLDHTGITYSEMLRLASWSSLESVNLSEGVMSDEGLQVLRSLRRLKTITLNCEKATDRTLIDLGDHDRLESLSMHGPTIHDASLQALAACKNLSSLSITDAGEITDAGLNSLSGLAHLRRLYFGEFHPTERNMAALGSLVQLQGLFMWLIPIDNAGLAKLSKLTELKTFRFEGSKATDMAVYSLAKLKSLKDLDLGRETQITELGETWLGQALPGARIKMHSKPRSVLRFDRLHH